MSHLREDLSDEARACIQGTTDSEYIGALFFTILDETYASGRGQHSPRPRGQWKAGGFTAEELRTSMQATTHRVQSYIGPYK